VIEACADTDGLLCNLAPVPAEVVEKLEKCRVISRYGVGMDNVDIAACTARRIYLGNVPDYCAEEVSDQALALLMSCARKTARRDAQVRQGLWNICRKDPIYRIAGKTIGLLGYGLIARCFHRKLKGLNPDRVLIFDPYIDEDTIKSAGAIKADFETVLKESDFISIHLPLNDHTRKMIGASAFELMKSTAILINTSRGAVIDENALIEALRNGTINSAGLDTFEIEPLPMDSPLRELDNCVLSDHVGFYSEESLVELKRKTAENVLDVLEGRPPKYWVNKFD
jgi:D-3-phosphoglycerate dehydrogenase